MIEQFDIDEKEIIYVRISKQRQTVLRSLQRTESMWRVSLSRSFIEYNTLLERLQKN